MNRYPVATLLVLFLLTPMICLSAEPRNQIRVLSYNIHHGAGIDGKLDLPRIAKVIQSVSPDLVSLQEVDVDTMRTGKVDQAKELAKLTGMKGVFRASMKFQGGEYGNAILTNLPIVDTEKNPHVIPLPGEPRSALCLTVKKVLADRKEVDFIFIATHLDTKKEPRSQSPDLIEKFFADQPDAISVLAGDLNAVPQSVTMDLFRKSWIDVTNEDGLFTVPVKNPDKQIDYVLARPAKHWKVISAKVLDESVASDHRPILSVLEFVGQ